MRDTRRRRLILVVLILASLTLIALGGGGSGPGKVLRDGAGAVFGPVERAVAAVFTPVRNFFGGLNGDDQAELDRLRRENDELRVQQRANEYTAARAQELNDLLKLAGLGRVTITLAQVISVSSAQSTTNNALLDAGSNDGLKVNMIVINGQGLVGRIVSVTATTATVKLAIDPEFGVGGRLEKTVEIGAITGQGPRAPMLVKMLDQQAALAVGDRFVTSADAGFPGGIPIGTLSEVSGEVGSLGRSATLKPFVDFTSLDVVGVVVARPRTDPRDALLPGPLAVAELDPPDLVAARDHAVGDGQPEVDRVTARRVFLTAVLLGTAAVLQVVVLQRIPLPGATPDLVMLVVISLALVQGSNEGAVVGFAGGLLLDLLPPAESQVGRWALVLALVGWFAGRAADAAEESALVPVLVVALCSAGSVLLYAGIGYALGDVAVFGSGALKVLATAVLYDVMLTPFVVPWLMKLARRVEPVTTYARTFR